MTDGAVTGAVRDYYESRLHAFGATAKGVDWNSTASQVLRFDQLLPTRSRDAGRSLLDYGCGYGALLTYLRTHEWTGDYVGYDLSYEMVTEARRQHPDDGQFVTEVPTTTFEFTVASGVLNVRLGFAEKQWEDYIDSVLDEM